MSAAPGKKKAHQRPKLERYAETLFVVLRPARYIDESETVEFGEIHAFVGPDFVVTVRHGKASTLDRVRQRLESMPELLRRGPEAILYAIMDQVVDDYAPVVAGLENDIDEIEILHKIPACRARMRPRTVTKSQPQHIVVLHKTHVYESSSRVHGGELSLLRVLRASTSGRS